MTPEHPPLDAGAIELSMARHRTACLRFFMTIGAAFFLLGFLAAAASTAGFLLAFYGVPLFLGLLVVGGLYLCWRGIRIWRRTVPGYPHRVFHSFLAPILFFFALLAAWPLLGVGSQAGGWVRLLIGGGSASQVAALDPGP